MKTVTVEDHDSAVFLALEVHPVNDHALNTLLPKPSFRELEQRIANLQVNFRHKPIYRSNPELATRLPSGTSPRTTNSQAI
jgi:hypothetical protein